MNALKKIGMSAIRSEKSQWLRALVWRLTDGLVQKVWGGPSNDRTLGFMVHSFDGYKRFWQPMLFFAERSIPPQFPTYYASERVPMHANEEVCILTDKGHFVKRLIAALKVLGKKHKYVFYLQEDFWLDREISASTLEGLLGVMETYDLDCLKLGERACHYLPEEREKLLREAEPISGAAVAFEGETLGFRWYGGREFSMSHQSSIFRTTYFLSTAMLASLFGVKDPNQHERFTSSFLRDAIKSSHDDKKPVRIALCTGKPAIDYVHACSVGRLNAEGKELLDKYGIQDYYDESLSGEVFPAKRTRMTE